MKKYLIIILLTVTVAGSLSAQTEVKKEYHSNGKLKREYTLKNGVKDGLEKGYYENGQINIETPYLNGRRNGTAKRYRENGTIDRETIYKDGIIISYKMFYENGKISEEGNGIPPLLRNGPVKGYYESGKLKY